MSEAPVLLFEASWEVCNKVGGIYTVMTTKMAHAQAQFPGAYLGIGPYYGGDDAAFTFQREELPVRLQGLAAHLEQQGVIVHYGTWLTEGRPPVVLLSWDGLIPRLNELKARFWEQYGLDTLGTDFYDVDQPLMWGVAIGMFVQAYAAHHPQPILLQAHEWMTAGALLILAHAQLPNVGTVFTTHATVLGRALSAQGVDLYAQLDTFRPEEEARRSGVTAKHQLESLAARLSTVFTTVSAITGEEATAFLGRKPDLLVENGLDTDLFPDFDQISRARSEMRAKLDDLMAAYFFPSYRFDLSKTTYHYTMGRYEIHNKGYDLHLEALGQLNARMKAAQSLQTLVTMILVPADAGGVRPEVAMRLLAYHRLQEKMQGAGPGRTWEVYRALWERSPDLSPCELPQSLQGRFDRTAGRLTAMSRPDISPYVLRGGAHEITRLAHRYGLENGPNDPVKVLFCPVYLDGLDGLFNMPLYEIVTGCDLGVFPSLYEPWGYTPMESLALGVPAVTSTLAGFGQAVTADGEDAGVFLLDRRRQTPAESLEGLTAFLQRSLDENPRFWLRRRINSYLTAQSFSWDRLYENYREAYARALPSA